MTKTPISVPDLRISPYIKAKAEPAWRFWGLYAFFAAPRRLR
jgi:RNA-directed DNA polymerase